MLRGMAQVMTVRGLWPIMPMFLASYAVLMALRGLWSGPYLSDVFHLDAGDRHLYAGNAGSVSAQYQMAGCYQIVTDADPAAVTGEQSSRGPLFRDVGLYYCGVVWLQLPVADVALPVFLAPAHQGRGMALLTALSFIEVALIQCLSG
jgi:hypothetical protein